jgi:antitoxin CptB
MLDEIETRRRKLAFRAARRGFRELDLFMQQFTVAHLDSFNEERLDQFEAVLDIPDQHVFDWIMGRGEPPQNLRSEVLDLLLSFRYSPPT